MTIIFIIVTDYETFFITKFSRTTVVIAMLFYGATPLSRVLRTLSFQDKDLLQMMIDARPDEDDSDQGTKWSLTDKEIVSLSVGFLLAGYDTTANTLGYAAYLLAINSDKQDILIQEIDAYLAQNKVRLFSWWLEV